MIPLTVRSYYSLMWGTRSPRKICAVAKQLGYSRLALTDTDNLYGLWPFLNACDEMGIAPIVGAELTDPVPGSRAVCLVENPAGYRNLCRLITRRHSSEKGTFDLKSAVPDYAEGLVILTQSAELLRVWHAAGITVAASVPRRPDATALRLHKTAQHLCAPVVATPGSFFLVPDDFGAHRVLRAIDRNTSLSRLTPKNVVPSDAWLAPPSEYRHRFDILPEALRTTEEIAERLTFTGPQHD
ncbi:MAG: PHP domain-containing protein, partial [Deltaproteobacteria bacterium]|nr:PHP domain-containing protein [Deltaproteobacteria bacterium]